MLVVASGLCPIGANSYAELAQADSYLVPRGLWPATESVAAADGTELDDQKTVLAKERALIRSFDWLNSLEWLGEPLHWEQEAAWPRKNVPMLYGSGCVSDAIVPQAVIRAQFEVAALVFNGRDMLAPQEHYGAIRALSVSKKEGDVDVIGGDSESLSYTFADPVSSVAYYPAVASLLRPYLAKIPGATSGFQTVDIWWN